MQIYQFESFEDLLNKKGRFKDFFSSSCSLTIGNYDGVHLGHIAVLKRLIEKEKPSVVFTFSNHPTEILYQKKIPWLTTLPHRLALLKKCGVDSVILLPFDHTLSQQPAEEFLTKLQEVLPFSSLILGHDAVIGQGRKGNSQTLMQFAQKKNFSLEYVEPLFLENEIVSSSHIRKCIQEGKLDFAKAYLGRPFSIQAMVEIGEGKGKLLGFHTANLPISHLCLPPLGVWIVEVALDNHPFRLKGVANLGYAPTVHENRQRLLEVHLLDFEQDLYKREIEVFFLKFLREEKRFESLDALKKQIAIDINLTKSFFEKSHN